MESNSGRRVKMPFRRTSRPTGYAKRFSAAVKLRQNKRATRAAASRALTRKIRSVVQRGKESKDTASALSPDNGVSTSGMFQSLISMGQGAGVWARTGDFVDPTKVVVFHQLGMPAGSDSYNNVRLMVIQLKVPASEVTTSDMPGVWDRITDEQRRLFRVLHDRRIVLNAKPLGDNSGNHMSYKLPIRAIQLYGKRLHKAQWSDSSAVVEPNVKGAIRLYAVSDSTISPHPLLSYRYEAYAKED